MSFWLDLWHPSMQQGGLQMRSKKYPMYKEILHLIIVLLEVKQLTLKTTLIIKKDHPHRWIIA